MTIVIFHKARKSVQTYKARRLISSISRMVSARNQLNVNLVLFETKNILVMKILTFEKKIAFDNNMHIAPPIMLP